MRESTSRRSATRLGSPRRLFVALPVTAATREALQSHFGAATLKPDPAGYLEKDFAALLEIQCQECDRTFPVASSWNLVENALARNEKNPPQDCKLPHAGDAGDFTYGDAPWHDSDPDRKGQCGGTTMTTFVVRILQFYKRDVGDWIRLPEHEVYVGEQDQP